MRPIHLLFLALASVGVVIIVGPAELGDHLLVNVMSVILAALFGQYILLTRRLPRCQHPVELLFQDGAFAGIAFSLAFLVSAQLTTDRSSANWPDLAKLVTAPAIATLLGTISSLVMVDATSLTPNAKLAPVSYLEIVSASCIGVFIFALMLTPGKILRIIIVVCVCLTNVMTSRRSNA